MKIIVFILLSFVIPEASALTLTEETLQQISATNQQILESHLIIAHWVVAALGIIAGTIR